MTPAVHSTVQRMPTAGARHDAARRREVRLCLLATTCVLPAAWTLVSTDQSKLAAMQCSRRMNVMEAIQHLDELLVVPKPLAWIELYPAPPSSALRAHMLYSVHHGFIIDTSLA